MITNSHERRERQRERLITLRRDVYLPAADAVCEATGAVANMAQEDTPFREVSEGLGTFSPALTRIQMVGTAETVRRVAEYQRGLFAMVSALSKLRYPMVLRKQDIDLADRERSRYHDERLKCIEMMKEYNRSGERDPQRFRTTQRQADFAGEQSAHAHSEWLRLVLAQEIARVEMLRELGNQAIELSKLQARVLAAIRRELEAGDASPTLIEEETRETSVVATRITATEVIPMLDAVSKNFGLR